MSKLHRSYEYAVATMDEHGDIHNYDFVETYSEALKCAADIDGHWMIELWANVGNDERGLVDRDMYEVIDGVLQGDFPRHVAKHFAMTAA
jgi:hypothetical protein